MSQIVLLGPVDHNCARLFSKSTFEKERVVDLVQYSHVYMSLIMPGIESERMILSDKNVSTNL